MGSQDISMGTAPQTGAGWSESEGKPKTGTREQMSQKVTQMTSQMRSKTSKALDSTTRNLDQMATYIREKDMDAMARDLQHVIRQHPGRSVVAGLVLGVLVGRILR